MKSRSEELKNNKEIFFQNTFCDIFHRTAQLFPDKVAVSGDNCQVTYQELDEYSNFLTRYLMKEYGRKALLLFRPAENQLRSSVCWASGKREEPIVIWMTAIRRREIRRSGKNAAGA